jgi:hypothetical protein
MIPCCDDELMWDSEGCLLVASPRRETLPAPRAVDTPRSFLNAKSRALTDRLKALPISERTLMSPQPRQPSPPPLRRSRHQSKQFLDRQMASAARRRTLADPSPETPKTTSTFGSFLSRQHESNKRRNEVQSTPGNPEYSFSPHHAQVGAKVAQVPPIFSDERAAMMSSAAERAKSKIASEVMEANTFRFVRPESSQKAIVDAESRKEEILQKAIKKRQKIFDEVTSARQKAEKDAEEERKAAKTSKGRSPNWPKRSENLVANFFKRSGKCQAEEEKRIPEGLAALGLDFYSDDSD